MQPLLNLDPRRPLTTNEARPSRDARDRDARLPGEGHPRPTCSPFWADLIGTLIMALLFLFFIIAL